MNEREMVFGWDRASKGYVVTCRLERERERAHGFIE